VIILGNQNIVSNLRFLKCGHKKFGLKLSIKFFLALLYCFTLDEAHERSVFTDILIGTFIPSSPENYNGIQYR
jgi:hypothetical protein